MKRMVGEYEKVLRDRHSTTVGSTTAASATGPSLTDGRELTAFHASPFGWKK